MYILAPNVTALNVLSLKAPGEAQLIQKLDIAGPASVASLQISEYPIFMSSYCLILFDHKALLIYKV